MAFPEEIVRKLLFYLFIFYCLFLLFLSSIPIPESIPAIEGLDKIIHFVEYMMLSFIVYPNVKDILGVSGKWETAALAMIFSCLYGGLMEIVQSFIPGRSADILDFVFDVLGALCAQIFIFTTGPGRKGNFFSK